MNALAGLPPFRSPSDILRHPNFRKARDTHCRMNIELYAEAPFNQLYMAAPRNMLFGSIIALWAAHDPDERSTWPTLSRLKAQTAGFDLCSPRMVDDVVARLKSMGHLEEVPAAGDARVKLLRPTELMMARDRRYNRVMFVPLEVLFPDSSDYRAGVQMDPDFHIAQRMVGFSLMQQAHQRVHDHAPMFRHFVRDAGYAVVAWISSRHAATGSAVPFSLSEMAVRAGVSRTHIRSVLAELAADGYLALSRAGQTQLVEPTERFIEHLDAFIADVLSAHDLMTQLVHMTARRPAGISSAG